jgi:hypothetical protein
MSVPDVYELRERFVRVEEQQKVNIERVGELHDEIHGNGKPGLKAMVARHEDRFDQIGKFIWIVIAAVVGNIVAAIFVYAAIVKQGGGA